ncbi:MAG: hypothetical protein C0502_02300 [Opitutus sp.]|nr:hypothetical protein [Opitutus sp.]
MNRNSAIYLVEDEAVIALQLREILGQLGYHVCGHAMHGETALAQIPRLRPDLVLMDINLPGRLSGIETAARLRATSTAPVVFLSAYSDTATVADAVRTGPFGYVAKPVDEGELRATIEVALHKHREHEALRRAGPQPSDDAKMTLDVCPVCHRIQDHTARWRPLGDHLTAADPRFVPTRCPDCTTPAPQPATC